jgi:hypothetical protein
VTYFFISFATHDGFLGATIVRADDAQDALVEASFRGLNPGGEAMILEAPPEVEDAPDFKILLNRLASKSEMIAHGGRRKGDLESGLKEAIEDAAEFVCAECNTTGSRRQ